MGNLSLDSKVKDILRSEEGKAVMEKYSPGSTTDPRMKLVGGMTQRKLLSFPESDIPKELWDQFDADLRLRGPPAQRVDHHFDQRVFREEEQLVIRRDKLPDI